MLGKSQNQSQYSLFFSLASTLNHKHPLFILMEKVDWTMFEEDIELIFKESIRINGDDLEDKDIYIDRTVQKKEHYLSHG